MIYIIIDENMKPARHNGKGKLAAFTDLDKLEKNAWRYIGVDGKKNHKIAELTIDNVLDFKELK